MSTREELDRINLGNDIYEVLCRYFPQYEMRGFNFHTRSQIIVEAVQSAFDDWVNANRKDSDK